MAPKHVQISIEFDWQSLGSAQNDTNGKLKFPIAPRQPGLYRLRLCGKGESRHYIGETDELRRRLQHYRTPGAKQQTNIRMEEKCRDHMAADGDMEVDIVVDKVAVAMGGEALRVDLTDKTMRRMLEHAALVTETAAGTDLLNR